MRFGNTFAFWSFVFVYEHSNPSAGRYLTLKKMFPQSSSTSNILSVEDPRDLHEGLLRECRDISERFFGMRAIDVRNFRRMLGRRPNQEQEGCLSTSRKQIHDLEEIKTRHQEGELPVLCFFFVLLQEAGFRRKVAEHHSEPEVVFVFQQPVGLPLGRARPPETRGTRQYPPSGHSLDPGAAPRSVRLFVYVRSRDDEHVLMPVDVPNSGHHVVRPISHPPSKSQLAKKFPNFKREFFFLSVVSFE